MFRKIGLLLLVAAWVLAALTPAMSADYQCVLEEEGDPELHEDNPEADETYFGYNYLAKYRLPELKLYIFDKADPDDESEITTGFKLSWDITFSSSNLKLKELSADSSGGIFVVSGFLPESSDAYTEEITVKAKVTDTTEDMYRAYAVGVEISFDVLTVEVKKDDEHTAATSDALTKYLVHDSNTDIHEVTRNYKVTVTVSADYAQLLTRYDNYIQSEDEYTINLPEWLTWELTGEQENFGGNEDLESEFTDRKAITSIVIKFNDSYDGKLLGDLQDGTIAKVNVPFLGLEGDGVDASFLLSWDVTYRKPAPFTVTSGSPMSFTLWPGSTDVKTAQYSGSEPVSITSNDTSSGVRFNTAAANGTITVTVEASDSAAAGSYNKTFTFTDAYGNSGNVTANVTVVQKPIPLTPKIAITGEPKTFSLKAGESASTTLTASGDVSGDVTWTVGTLSPAADILVTCSGDVSAKVSIVVGQNVSADTYSVTVSAKDSAGTSANTTLRITVTTTVPPIPDPSEDSTDITSKVGIKNEDGTAVNSRPFSTLAAGSKATYTISLEGTGITARAWKLLINGTAVSSAAFTSAADSWARIVTSNATSATVEAAPPADLSTDSQISLSVTGNDGKEYTADLGTVKKATADTNYNLGSSDGGCNAGAGVLMLAAVLFAFRRNSRSR
ncbi:MAG: hypothetical protein IJT02_09720 [Synergistaceae bacterium]|nr:hypothetical protein [Synergistaceae bacterium]